MRTVGRHLPRLGLHPRDRSQHAGAAAHWLAPIVEVEALVRQYVRGEAQGAPGAQAFAVDRGEVRGEPLEEHVAGPAGPVAAREGVTGEGLGSECLLALQRYDRVVSIDIAGEAAALARAGDGGGSTGGNV